jgi:hypothetical protein
MPASARVRLKRSDLAVDLWAAVGPGSFRGRCRWRHRCRAQRNDWEGDPLSVSTPLDGDAAYGEPGNGPAEHPGRGGDGFVVVHIGAGDA